MPGRTLTRKLIAAHLVDGDPTPGEEIALHIDQTLTQDATGTLVMQELEAIGLDRARTDVSVQYVDHNLLQADERNAEDHEFLRSAARRYGLWFSKPGNGVSHPTHMQRFGVPGATLAGSDSHTCAAGSLGTRRSSTTRPASSTAAAQWTSFATSIPTEIRIPSDPPPKRCATTPETRETLRNDTARTPRSPASP